MALLLRAYIIVKLSVNSVRHVLDGEESFVLHYELKCFSWSYSALKGYFLQSSCSSHKYLCWRHFLFAVLCPVPLSKDTLVFILQQMGVKKKAARANK